MGGQAVERDVEGDGHRAALQAFGEPVAEAAVPPAEPALVVATDVDDEAQVVAALAEDVGAALRRAVLRQQDARGGQRRAKAIVHVAQQLFAFAGAGGLLDSDGTNNADDADDANVCIPTPNEDTCDADGDGTNNVDDADDANVCIPTPNEDACDGDGDGTNNGGDATADDNVCIPTPNEGACDADGEGLTIDEQDAAGTDPSIPDSDDDGLNDGDELNGATPSNPNDECDPTLDDAQCDADGDSDTNDEELDNGTDPNDVDTDGDGERDGADSDSDGDGEDDALESYEEDADGDGVNDESDPANLDTCIPNADAGNCDQDGDGKVNSEDNCPTTANAGQDNALGGAGGDACTETVLSGGGLVSCSPTTGEGTAPFAAFLGLFGLLGARRRRRVTAPVAAAVAAALVAGSAQAEAVQVPADSFRPAMDTDGVIDTDWAATSGHLSMDGGLFLDYALNPLVLNTVGEDGALTRATSLVAHRLGGNVIASMGFFDWLQVGIDVPVVLFQTRDVATLPTLRGVAVQALSVGGVGDLRLRPKFRILRAETAVVDLAVIPTVTLPTSTASQSFLGESSFTVVPELAVSKALGDLRLTTNVGARLRGLSGELANIRIGNELTYRGAVGYRLGTTGVEVGGSVTGATCLTAPFEASTENPLEAVVGLGYSPAGPTAPTTRTWSCRTTVRRPSSSTCRRRASRRSARRRRASARASRWCRTTRKRTARRTAAWCSRSSSRPSTDGVGARAR